MFSEENENLINYHFGSSYRVLDIPNNQTLKNRHAHDILLASYTLVRSNCEDACSAKLLGELSDDKKKEYRENTKISQITLKTVNDQLQKDLDSCLRRCFGILINLLISSKID